MEKKNEESLYNTLHSSMIEINSYFNFFFDLSERVPLQLFRVKSKFEFLMKYEMLNTYIKRFITFNKVIYIYDD